MRKLFSLFLTLVATASLWAYDFQSGNLHYNITSDTTVEVTSGDYYGLISVTIPSTVTYYGTTYSVTSIGDRAFEYCSSLTSITIPNSVTSIGDYAFYGCSSLTSPVYNAHCFAYLPTSYSGAYTIPKGIEQIAGGAFYNCSSLTAITIPNSVTSIGESALMYCRSITSISIPSSVASIGSFVLAFCDALVAISVDPTNTIYDSRENCNGIVETKTNSLVAGCQTTILPNSLETIKCGAMSCCRNLGSIYIPKSVTTIETASFCSCASLVSIVVDKDNPMYDSRNNCNAIIESSTDNLITGCQKTIIPHDVISIHDSAFYSCTSLSSIVIPHNVKSIGEDAFYFCTGLASVTFGNNLTTIGEGAFYNSNNIKSIYCYAINPPEIYNNTFSFYYSNPTLYVPCEALPDYQEQWGQFTTIECIASEEAETEEVVVESGTTTVIITWPTEEGADTYTIVIKKDGEVVCTLTFNSEGQLISIAFAPGRDGNHPAQYAEAVANGKGFRFTVTGLEYATDYTYDITVKNEANQVIKTHSGKFTTEPYSAVDNTHSSSSATNTQKLLRNGQLIILRDGVEYNAMGAEIQ